jgi:hypothetical protein
MTSKQLSILNALVTYAAETIPGGISDEEREVAQTVGSWALHEGSFYDYKIINTSHHETMLTAANAWAERGWRVVAALSAKGPGYADRLILERPIWVSHPDD